jgi:poly(3-hydroxybutyrate) depolymerase
MLYQIYETQRSLMEPFADFSQAISKLYSHPASPLSQTSLAQRVSAGYDLLYRLGKGYEKPAFDIPTVDVDGVGIAIHERVEINKPFCELRRFKRFSDDPATLTKLKGQPVVLIVAPLSGHYATLLRDTVRTMLKDHKVYITDWRNARLVPLSEGEFHLDDYVNYVQEFIRHLQGIYGNCHVISVCQPTVPVLAAVSLMASRGETTPITMTMMGGPIDARRSPTAVNNLATNRSYEWFENNVIFRVPDNCPGAGRRVYPGFLQYTGFVAMNPDRHATSHYDYFKDLIKGDDASVEAHRKFYDEYNAVLDMDADYYLETIKTVFQDYSLVHGTWDVRSPEGKIERVRPQDITTTALFTVEGELDDISGSGQTEAAHDLCTGIVRKEQHHLEAKGAGHYGIFSGRRWRDIVYPEVRAFILQHEKPSDKPSTPVATPASEPLAAVSATPVPSAPVIATPAPENSSAANAAQTVSPSPVEPSVEGPSAAKAPRAAAKAAAKVVPEIASARPAKRTAKAAVPAVTAPAAVAKPKAAQAARPNPAPASVATRWVTTAGTDAASTAPSTAAAAKTAGTARASAPVAPSPKRPTRKA